MKQWFTDSQILWLFFVEEADSQFETDMANIFRRGRRECGREKACRRREREREKKKKRERASTSTVVFQSGSLSFGLSTDLCMYIRKIPRAGKYH